MRFAGASTKENVGISNDNAGEKPAHRKTKVSSVAQPTKDNMPISWFGFEYETKAGQQELLQDVNK